MDSHRLHLHLSKIINCLFFLIRFIAFFFFLNNLFFFFMLWTHYFEALAVHFSLRVEIITKHWFSINMSFIIWAEKRLTFNLNKQNLFLFKKKIQYSVQFKIILTLLKHFSICFRACLSLHIWPHVTQYISVSVASINLSCSFYLKKNEKKILNQCEQKQQWNKFFYLILYIFIFIDKFQQSLFYLIYFWLFLFLCLA